MLVTFEAPFFAIGGLQQCSVTLKHEKKPTTEAWVTLNVSAKREGIVLCLEI
jgi:hypothetical protein